MSNAITNSTVLAPALQAFYDKKFLLRAQAELAGYQFGQKRALPGGVGKTVYFSRYMPLNKVTSPLDETDDGGIPLSSRQKFKTEEVSATAALWGDYVAISKLASITAIDKDVSQKVDIIGQQAGESIDAYVLGKVGAGMLRRRADGDPTYQFNGTAASGSTTTLVTPDNAANGSTGVSGTFNGGFLTIVGGTNYGQTRQISTSALSGTYVQTITVSSAFPKACDATSEFRVVVGTGIVSTDVLTTANIRLALRDLKRGKAMKAEKGYYIGLINPDIEYDFMGDTTFVQAATYKDSVDSLYTGEIGKWLGIRFVGASQLMRESVAGVADDAGAIHVASILGKEAYGVIELEGQSQKIYIKTPEQLAQAIPMYSTCGWQVGFESKILNSCFSVNVLCGATA